MAFKRTYSEYEERLKPTLHFYLYNDSYRWDFTNMVQGHTFDGDINTAAESFSISVWNRQEDNDRRKLPFEEGLMVKVVLEYKSDTGKPSDPKELFRGIIISRSLSAEGEEDLSIYDYNWYLAQNEVTKTFKKKRADQIVSELGRTAGVPIGYMANTKLVFTELEFIDKTIWEIMQTVITETYLRTGKRYKIRSEAGKLALREVAMNMKRLLVERGANMLGASRSISIQDVKTQVIMTGGKNPNNPRQVKSDAAAKKKYGTMTVMENDPEITGPGGLASLAAALLKQLKEPKDEISVEALADYTITAGTMIEAYDDFTGASGYYYVTSHSHTDARSMSLQLSKSYEQDLIRYEMPEAKEESAASIDGKVEKVTYNSSYVGTAYDPTLGGINGSGNYLTTASGTRWAYNRTIAVDPKVIPYGSIVHIVVGGFPQYSAIYLAEDTGGAINGKRIDLLIKGKKETATFGRRGIQVAILEVGKGKADARNKANNWNAVKDRITKKFKPAPKAKKATGKRAEIVETAKSYTGKLKYQFGGKNIASGSGDCSGFTYTVMKKHGVNIGHGTTSQLTKGKKVAKSAAQPGDLVFFKGTYRAGVSHVGIVTTPGKCVSLASSGCQEHSYTSGYWGQHFMQINKVL